VRYRLHRIVFPRFTSCRNGTRVSWVFRKFSQQMLPTRRPLRDVSTSQQHAYSNTSFVLLFGVIYYFTNSQNYGEYYCDTYQFGLNFVSSSNYYIDTAAYDATVILVSHCVLDRHVGRYIYVYEVNRWRVFNGFSNWNVTFWRMSLIAIVLLSQNT